MSMQQSTPGLSAIVSHVPPWVWILFAFLVFLGLRRLRARTVPPFVIAIAPAAFLIWSLSSLPGHAAIAGWPLAIGIWIAGFLVGAGSFMVLPDKPATRDAAGRYRLPATVTPLLQYLAVFVIRFALAIWAAIDHAAAPVALGLALAVSASMSGRTAAAFDRLRRLPRATA